MARLSLTLPFSFSFRFFLPFALTTSVAIPAGTALLVTAPVEATCAPCPDPERSPGLGRLKARSGALLLVPHDAPEGEGVAGHEHGRDVQVTGEGGEVCGLAVRRISGAAEECVPGSES